MHQSDTPIYVPELDPERFPMDHTRPDWWLACKGPKVVAAFHPAYFRDAKEVYEEIRDRFNLNSNSDGETFPGGNVFLNRGGPENDADGFGSDFCIWRNGRCHMAVGEHEDNDLTASHPSYLDNFTAPKVPIPRGWPTRLELAVADKLARPNAMQIHHNRSSSR